MNASSALISGVVTDLVVARGEEEFVQSAGQHAVGVGAAAGLAATGLAGAGAGAALAASSSGDSVEFFSCKIGREAVEGRFSRVTFKDDDELIVVLDNLAVQPTALAAKRARDRSLWIVPHCSRGVGAHRAFAIRMFHHLLIALATFFMTQYLVFGVWINKFPLELSGIQFAGAISVVLGFVAAAYYSIRFYRQWLPIARQAEAIFAALGYPDPSRVDLPRDHKRYCKAQGIKWPYLTDGPWIYHYPDPR